MAIFLLLVLIQQIIFAIIWSKSSFTDIIIKAWCIINSIVLSVIVCKLLWPLLS